MSSHYESVARYMAEKAGWDVSNLKLQRLMYIAQMIHMGRNDGAPLFDADFQAWDYGPVIPPLYQKLKVYGAGQISDVFSSAKLFGDGDSRRKIMDDVAERFLQYSAGGLVNITHSEKGAWAKHYVPGARNVPIPRESIFQEYLRRTEDRQPVLQLADQSNSLNEGAVSNGCATVALVVIGAALTFIALLFALVVWL